MAYITTGRILNNSLFKTNTSAIQYIDRFALKVEGSPSANTVMHKYLRRVKTEQSYPAFEDFTF